MSETSLAKFFKYYITARVEKKESQNMKGFSTRGFAYILV